MKDYALSPDVLLQLETVASNDKRNVAELLDDIVKEYIARRHEAQISSEAARFRSQHSELCAKYSGQYIAMRDGKVIDHDGDLSSLHQRVRARFGNAPVLITPVTAEPVQEFRIRRPRLERIET